MAGGTPSAETPTASSSSAPATQNTDIGALHETLQESLSNVSTELNKLPSPLPEHKETLQWAFGGGIFGGGISTLIATTLKASLGAQVAFVLSFITLGATLAGTIKHLRSGDHLTNSSTTIASTSSLYGAKGPTTDDHSSARAKTSTANTATLSDNFPWDGNQDRERTTIPIPRL